LSVPEPDGELLFHPLKLGNIGYCPVGLPEFTSCQPGYSFRMAKPPIIRFITVNL
jgi:hypothetical protein